MSYYRKAVCPRCGRPFSGKEYEPCPDCKSEVLVNYETVYDVKGARLPEGGEEDGIFRYRDFFSLPENAPVLTIGEGDTPMRKLTRLGKELGLSNLYMKDESKNPTGSHKDRMCALMVSNAIAKGAPGMVIASTGNQGAAVAAYCQVAGLPCIVISSKDVQPTARLLMQVYGAQVVVVPTAADRLVLMKQIMDEMGYEPASGIYSPPIGSNFRAVDAYKSIAFEVYRQMKGVPDWFIIPGSYGDTMYGTYKGMADLKEMGYIDELPKMVVADVYGATKKSVESGEDKPISVPVYPSIQTAIAVGTTAYHTMKALRACNGTAEASSDAEALAMQELLVRTEGVFAEASSCASLVALKKLVADGKIGKDEKVVVLISSLGIKVPEVVKDRLPAVPEIEPDLETFRKATGMK
jgi:threonine synthase